MAPVVIFLAMLLAGSALHKAVSHRRMTIAAARLVGMPSQGQLFLIIAGTLEATAAVCLLAAPLQRTGALLGSVIWLAYAAALLLRRGQSFDCGCDLVAREKPIDWPAIVRPTALALLAAIASTLPAAPIGLDAPFAAAGFLALYLAASELLAIPHPRWRKS